MVGARHTFTGPRPWELIEPVAYNEIPDLTRGEQRFAAEVSLAQLRGELLPTWATERANATLIVMARG